MHRQLLLQQTWVLFPPSPQAAGPSVGVGASEILSSGVWLWTLGVKINPCKGQASAHVEHEETPETP